MKRRLIIAGVVILCVVGGVKGYSYYQESKKPKYELTSVKKGKISQTISASGAIKTGKEVVLKFQASGKLAWIGIKEGDRVNQWQAVARLDIRELEKDLKKELNDYMNERWDFEQTRDDYDVSTDDLDKYTLSDAARRVLEQAQFDLNNTVLDVEISDIAVEVATLISPIDGIVTKVEAPVAGVNVTSATSRITVSSPDAVYFEASVDENDIGSVQLGQRAEVFLDAYPEEELSGQVREISFVSVKTSGGGTAFPSKIYLDLPNVAEKFRIGMNGDVEILIQEKEDILYLPVEAVKSKNGVSSVNILENGQLKSVEIQTGLETDDYTEITQGLQEGTEVVIGEKKS